MTADGSGGWRSRLKPDWYLIFILGAAVLASVLTARGEAAVVLGWLSKILIGLVFLLGWLPTYLIHRARLWRVRSRLDSFERQQAAARTVDTTPIDPPAA